MNLYYMSVNSISQSHAVPLLINQVIEKKIWIWTMSSFLWNLYLLCMQQICVIWHASSWNLVFVWQWVGSYCRLFIIFEIFIVWEKNVILRTNSKRFHNEDGLIFVIKKSETKVSYPDNGCNVRAVCKNSDLGEFAGFTSLLLFWIFSQVQT